MHELFDLPSKFMWKTAGYLYPSPTEEWQGSDEKLLKQNQTTGELNVTCSLHSSHEQADTQHFHLPLARNG